MKQITTAAQYEELAMRTAKDMGSLQMNLIHAAMGIASDGGEFVDAIKKHAVYGKELDIENAIEELGDVLWFIALACKTLSVPMSDVMEANIQKLELRYPDKYSDEAAIARADKSNTDVDVDLIKIALFSEAAADSSISFCVSEGTLAGAEYSVGDMRDTEYLKSNGAIFK